MTSPNEYPPKVLYTLDELLKKKKKKIKINYIKVYP